MLQDCKCYGIKLQGFKIRLLKTENKISRKKRGFFKILSNIINI